MFAAGVSPPGVQFDAVPVTRSEEPGRAGPAASCPRAFAVPSLPLPQFPRLRLRDWSLQIGPRNLETILNSLLTFKKVTSRKFLNEQSEARELLLLVCVALPGRENSRGTGGRGGLLSTQKCVRSPTDEGGP